MTRLRRLETAVQVLNIDKCSISQMISDAPKPSRISSKGSAALTVKRNMYTKAEDRSG